MVWKIVGLIASTASVWSLNAAEPQSAEVRRSAAQPSTIEVVNPSRFARDQEFVTAESAKLRRAAYPTPWLANGKCRIPAQWSQNAQGNDQLNFVVDLPAKASRKLELSAAAAALPLCAGYWPVKATLVENSTSGERVNVRSTRVPASHRPGADLYGFEGIGWESGEVGYRLYLDARNKTDIFGKKLPAPVLETIALRRTPYHSMADWGMDILKVGESLGIGAPAAVLDGKIAAFDRYDAQRAAVLSDGPVVATVETAFEGWQVAGSKTDFVTRYSIAMGSRLTKVQASSTSATLPLATGIVRHEPLNRIQSKGSLAWRYIATCGEQSLVPDMLGMAIFYRSSDYAGELPDKNSHVVRLRPQRDGNISYYFGAFWGLDDEQFRNCGALTRHLDQLAERLSVPVKIAVR